MKFVATLLFTAILFSGFSQEQATGPTKEETIAWLKEAIESIDVYSEKLEKPKAVYDRKLSEFKLDISDGMVQFSFAEETAIEWASGKKETQRNRYAMNVALEDITKCTECFGVFRVPGSKEDTRRGLPCIQLTTNKLTKQSDGSTNEKIGQTNVFLAGHPKERTDDAPVANYKLPISSEIEEASARAAKAFNHLLTISKEKKHVLDKF